MDNKDRSEAKSSQVSDENRERIIQVLSLEYQTIRQEMLLLTSGRFQFLGLMTTAAALLTTGVFGSSVFRSQTWISAALAILVFAFGVACFVFLGRERAIVSVKAEEIERRINALLPAEPGFSAVLSLESNHKHLTLYGKLKLILPGTRVR
jgi:hypothetical protein